MNKSSFFTGQPILTQLFKLIPRHVITRAVKVHSSDNYYKKFDTHHHLVTLLYAAFQHCTSLREVVSGMSACEGRLQSLNIRHFPARATFADANKNRPFQVFEDIYQSLFRMYYPAFPDSRKEKLPNRLVIIDSTTISLFKQILKSAGNKALDGKRKGGIKVHTAVRAADNVPFLIRLTAGAAADAPFMKDLHLPAGSIVVMDKGYNNYKVLHEWTTKRINWVTRIKARGVVEVTRQRQLGQKHKEQGILTDEDVILGYNNKTIQRVKARLVRYYDKEKEKVFEFITNNRKWSPLKVAEIYKRRWQIELLFKRLKQNLQLQYFLGDNENAIKIQIYCALIADMLLQVASRGLKRRWAFSNLASIVRMHLMNYTNLRMFLENPDNCRICNPAPSYDPQLKLSLSG